MPPLISAVILVRNEAANLKLTLRSLQGWVDEIVVVDGESTDGSRQVAEAAGAKVFVRPPAVNIDADRPFAVAQSTGTWIFHIDADEVVPPALGKTLRLAAERDDADVIAVREQSWFLGEPCNVWRGHKERLFRRSILQTSDRIHKMYNSGRSSKHIILPGGPGMELHHYWTPGISPLLRRLDRYSAIEAQQRTSLSSQNMSIQALRAFVGAFVIDGGWRRGWRGVYLSLYAAFYRATVQARRIEASLGGQSAIQMACQAHAEALLADKPDANA